jgi:hypothetical protein
MIYGTPLARILRSAGLQPRSRLPQEPNFDLAWETDRTVFVAEVKSITDDNEEEQLWLGLGQVLQYRHQLGRLGHERVVAVLVPERSPRDAAWGDLCRELQVVLLSGKQLEHAAALGREAVLHQVIDRVDIIALTGQQTTGVEVDATTPSCRRWRRSCRSTRTLPSTGNDTPGLHPAASARVAVGFLH